jgi:hypothetical protein
LKAGLVIAGSRQRIDPRLTQTEDEDVQVMTASRDGGGPRDSFEAVQIVPCKGRPNADELWPPEQSLLVPTLDLLLFIS